MKTDCQPNPTTQRRQAAANRPVHAAHQKGVSAWGLTVGLAVAAFLSGLWVYAATQSQPLATSAPADAVQQVLRAGKPTVVEFGANNCVSCREMKPILHALAQDPRLAVTDVDILKERAYISNYQIRLMPTQVFYNAQGQEIGRHMGKISAEEILAQLGLTPANAGAAAPARKAAP
ncbi:MAG: hypothetical protein AUJ20_00330 [Comamonadaceae bacterium CG1_02_60_18]|nr:MAG: hypothetical protein AUJ20_00330 [Comamonadaceae bacterium CG1_02_60_18]PIQ56470.1 MAG: hypothetical protein COW02_01210 [Comamonadaceae bacterium CG12_big_fil_rev_8_21_14_0_65_59_15]